jgi:hypothetical protein
MSTGNIAVTACLAIIAYLITNLQLIKIIGDTFFGCQAFQHQ